MRSGRNGEFAEQEEKGVCEAGGEGSLRTGGGERLQNERREEFVEWEERGVCGTEEEGSLRNRTRGEFTEREERGICGTLGEEVCARREGIEAGVCGMLARQGDNVVLSSFVKLYQSRDPYSWEWFLLQVRFDIPRNVFVQLPSAYRSSQQSTYIPRVP